MATGTAQSSLVIYHKEFASGNARKSGSLALNEVLGDCLNHRDAF